MPVVQSYVQEGREAPRFAASTERAFGTARAHARALVAGRLHHQRHLRRAAVGPVPGHAGGAARRHQRRPPRADGRLRDHPGRQRRGAVRGVRRPAARRRRDRAADGAAGRALAGGCPRSRARCRPQRRAPRSRSSTSPSAIRRGRSTRAARLQPAGAPGETVALVGPSGAGKSTRVPAAAALLRRRSGHGADRRRAGARVPSDAARAHRHRAAGQRDLLDQRDGEHPLRPARRQRRRGDRRRARGLRPRLHQRPARGLPPSSASAACACRAASASASRSPARC